MSCAHAHDDGAYVLGALAPADRAAYERHLPTCASCHDAVADIAGLPGLLGRIDAAGRAALLEPDRARPGDRTPALVVAAKTARRRERRRGRRRTLCAALAAACLTLVAALGATFWLDRQRPPAPAAMRPVSADPPVTASINLTSTAWGTKVTMTSVHARAGGAGRSAYRLVAYGPDAVGEQVGSWTAAPGTEVTMSGMTRFAEADLDRFAVLREDGTTVFTYPVPVGGLPAARPH